MVKIFHLHLQDHGSNPHGELKAKLQRLQNGHNIDHDKRYHVPSCMVNNIAQPDVKLGVFSGRPITLDMGLNQAKQKKQKKKQPMIIIDFSTKQPPPLSIIFKIGILHCLHHLIMAALSLLAWL